LVIAWFLQDAEADKQRVVYSMAASTSSTSLEQFSSTSSRQLSLKSGSDQWVMVSRVVDGDTLEVMIDDEKQKIRLIGVNTPETVDPRRPVQCFGKKASAFTEKLLSDRLVRLEADSSQADVDKYGRLLRYVYLSDGRLLNQELIVSGYGREYTYKKPYKYQMEFRESEAKAKQDKLGLWADGACDIK